MIPSPSGGPSLDVGMVLVEARHHALHLGVFEPFEDQSELILAERVAHVSQIVKADRFVFHAFHDERTRLLVYVRADRRENIGMFAELPQYFKTIKRDGHREFLLFHGPNRKAMERRLAPIFARRSEIDRSDSTRSRPQRTRVFQS